MNLQSKEQGACNAPLGSLVRHKTYTQNISLIFQLQELIEIARYNTNKYRFDPAMRCTHEEYLTSLNEIVRGLK
jgi:hypothetical protein